MNLLGKTVKHKKLGKGTIISLDDTYIGVSFPTKDSIFLYPDAFDSFLTLESPSMQVAILHELTEKQIAKKIRHKEENEQRIAKALAENRNFHNSKKRNDRPHIAFKCNYCDGGKSDAQVGFAGACTDATIANNIFTQKRALCANAESPCAQYARKEITREELDACFADDESYVCYESQMLRNWKAYAGVYQSGMKKGKPMKLKPVQTNGLCILTTRDTASEEADRYIFGVFLVDDSYEGSETNEGYVSTKSKYKLKLSPQEAHQMLFWRYYANPKSPCKAHWGSMLYRKIDDTVSAQILMDIAKIKKGTEDEQLAKEFLTFFVKSNYIDISKVHAANGALLRTEQ